MANIPFFSPSNKAYLRPRSPPDEFHRDLAGPPSVSFGPALWRFFLQIRIAGFLTRPVFFPSASISGARLHRLRYGEGLLARFTPFLEFSKHRLFSLRSMYLRHARSLPPARPTYVRVPSNSESASVLGHFTRSGFSYMHRRLLQRPLALNYETFYKNASRLTESLRSLRRSVSVQRSWGS